MKSPLPPLSADRNNNIAKVGGTKPKEILYSDLRNLLLNKQYSLMLTFSREPTVSEGDFSAFSSSEAI
jgi:hypothetical protein